MEGGPIRSRQRLYGNRFKRRADEEDHRQGSFDSAGAEKVDNEGGQSSAQNSSPISSAPTTPKKRRVDSSITPSSSPLVKVNLDKKVFDLLSPKSQRVDNRQRIESDEEDSDESISPAMKESEFRSAKASFASRMAPRSNLTRPASPTEGRAKMIGRQLPLSERARDAMPYSRKSLKEQSSVGELKSTQAYRVGAVQSQVKAKPSQQIDEPDNVLLNSQFLLEDPATLARDEDMGSLRTRWDNLEEMEGDSEDDTETNVRSTTSLRSAGNARRFMDDYEFLMLDLKPDRSLKVRQKACLEIAQRMCSGDGATDFIASCRSFGIDASICKAMQHSGAGQCTDELMDICLVVLYKFFMVDAASLQKIIEETDCMDTIARLLPSTSQICNEKSNKNVGQLIQTAELVPMHCQHKSRAIIAMYLIRGIVSNTAVIEPFINSSSESKSDSIIAQIQRHLLENDADPVMIDAAAQTLCLCQNCTTKELFEEGDWFKRISKIIQTCWSDAIASNFSSQHLRATASCIQLLVLLTHRHEHLKDPSLTWMAQLTTQAVQNARRISQSDEKAVQLLDIAALALALMTNMLEKHLTEGTALQLTSESDSLESFKNLFMVFVDLCADEDGNHGDKRVVILRGCLAVVLSLLLIAGDEYGEEEDGKAARAMSRENAILKTFEAAKADQNASAPVKDALIKSLTELQSDKEGSASGEVSMVSSLDKQRDTEESLIQSLISRLHE